MAEKQTAGRDHLGQLAPEFAHLNDDVLFGEELHIAYIAFSSLANGFLTGKYSSDIRFEGKL